jgi:hypothetical protein
MTDTSAFDLGAAAPSNPDKLGKIVKIATETATLERDIAAQTELLSLQTARHTELRTRELPDAMAEAAMSEFKLDDGTSIKVEDFVSGSLPKEEEGKPESKEARAAAIKFLEDNGAGALIKNVLSIEFEKSQHNEALSLAQDLRDKGFIVNVKSDVHPQTYMAWARDALKQGLNLDAEALNLFIGRVAKLDIPGFKMPKKSKKAKKA